MGRGWRPSRDFQVQVTAVASQQWPFAVMGRPKRGLDLCRTMEQGWAAFIDPV